jgi:membrane-associated protein
LTLAVAQTGITGYVVLFLAVAASWIGIPIVGAGVLAAAGVLASEGELNIWLVLVVATAGACSGGFAGYLLGRHVGHAVRRTEGRWQRQRQHAIEAGERLYQRWGRVAVFLTPTWVSGALRMPRDTFLLWNAIAAIVSNCAAALTAYGIGAAVVGHLSKRRGTVALAIAAAITAAALLALVRSRRRDG